MSTPAGSQRRSDRQQRRVALSQRLLAAVERLVDDGETFTSLSVERIAAEAGAGRSTFYLYFQDKTELLECWYQPIEEEIDAATARWIELDGSSTFEELREVLSSIWETHLRHAGALRIIYDASAYDAVVRDVVAGSMARTVALLTKHIRAGQRAGWIDKAVLAKETATWLTWMGQRGCHELLELDDDRRLPGLIDAYARVVWAAVYAHAAAGAPKR